jgi:hypothetical protein
MNEVCTKYNNSDKYYCFQFHIASLDLWICLQVLGAHIKYTPNKHQNARVNATVEIKIIWQMDVTFVLMNQINI